MTDFDPHNINEGKDKDLDGIIRPQDLKDFTGQDKIVANLKIFVAAAKMRGESLDHVLFHYGQLLPQWSVSVLSVDKRENVIDQINETIALLETLRKNPQLVIPGVIKA